VILLDANLLLYAYNTAFDRHLVARRWLEETFGSGEPIGLPWPTVLAFLRLATNPRVFPRPLSPDEAGAIVDAWLAHPTTVLVHPGERHWQILRSFLRTGVRGPQVVDAHLAALAIEHGAALATADRGFAAYPGLRLIHPID
jgi:toxin-antitoxin system PIN domain toxin